MVWVLIKMGSLTVVCVAVGQMLWARVSVLVPVLLHVLQCAWEQAKSRWWMTISCSSRYFVSDTSFSFSAAAYLTENVSLLCDRSLNVDFRQANESYVLPMIAKWLGIPRFATSIILEQSLEPRLPRKTNIQTGTSKLLMMQQRML